MTQVVAVGAWIVPGGPSRGTGDCYRIEATNLDTPTPQLRLVSAGLVGDELAVNVVVDYEVKSVSPNLITTKPLLPVRRTITVNRQLGQVIMSEAVLGKLVSRELSRGRQ